MARGWRVAGTSVLVVVLGAGAYATADAYDVVPGAITLAPVPAEAAPFPTAPGALEPADATTALTALDPAVPLPVAATLQAKVDALATDTRLGATVGVVVADQLTGEVLASHLADQGRTPASTAKLVTAVAALGTLSGDLTLDTRVVRGDGDAIVLVGGGDMMLAEGAGDPDAVNGHAGLADLAAQVARSLLLEGRTSVQLTFDDSLFSGPALSPQWDPADIRDGYVAPVTALAVDIAKMSEGAYPPRYTDPSARTAQVFATRLAEAGVSVTGTPTRVTADDGALELGVVHSATLDKVVHHFLDTSDNTITEVVSRLVALDAGLPGSFEGGSQAVLRAVAALGADITGCSLVDASGLGAGSVLTPDLLLDLLQLSTDPAHPLLREVATGMPIAGLTGTLVDRYTTSDARGLVRAKTGSLPGVTSLAGTVLDADRRQLLFVVIADQTPEGGQWAPRSAIDAFVSDLAGCGCR